MKAVFIGGCVRAGTTMLGAMLGAHPEHVCPPEMPFKIDLLRRSGPGWALSGPDAQMVASRHWKAPVLGWDLDQHDWAFQPETAPAAIESIVRGYGAQHGKPDARVWIDHTPLNIRWAASLADAFPDARFVHLVRDGRAVASSMMRVEWGPDTAYDAARFWTERVAQGLAAEIALSGRCVRVRYEDLVTDPEPTLRALCDDLGIEYHADMATGGGFRPTAYIEGQHALVGKPPDAARADGWKAHLGDRDVEIFEAAVGDLLPFLGYEPRFGLRARALTRRERWGGDLRHAIRRHTVRRVRKRARIRAARRG